MLPAWGGAPRLSAGPLFLVSFLPPRSRQAWNLCPWEPPCLFCLEADPQVWEAREDQNQTLFPSLQSSMGKRSPPHPACGLPRAQNTDLGREARLPKAGRPGGLHIGKDVVGFSDFILKSLPS